ncbi:MAG TPA: hypothetical protein VF608_12965 [Thermoanaerobaculia bacterium]
MRFFVRSLAVLLLVVCLFSSVACQKKEEGVATATQSDTAATAPAVAAASEELKLFETTDAKGNVLHGAAASQSAVALRINPGTQAEAEAYYIAVRTALRGFPVPTLPESRIGDMLVYYGFPALLAKDIESIDPPVLVDFNRLRTAVSNAAEFQRVYASNPLQPGEINSVRFFAPKIINVRDPQVGGVPAGGFGWRKIVRFRARNGSPARTAGLDSFFLLFNFTTKTPKYPPAGTHAGQLQAILQPVYPHRGAHRDLYFLVYERLDDPTNAEKVGYFLKATFDLEGVVPDDKYYVPRSCGQCHGTVASDQKRAKVNYLDTDHFIDRTGDDFTRVAASDVLVDGSSSYNYFRVFNTEIETQNAAVIDGGAQFALLAARKWLELHKPRTADEARHVPPLRRGFVQNAGDATWTDGATPDTQLLPELNRYCFRCHSSVNYHVFQKTSVIGRKSSIISRIDSGSMPQDRELDDATKRRITDLVKALP